MKELIFAEFNTQLKEHKYCGFGIEDKCHSKKKKWYKLWMKNMLLKTRRAPREEVIVNKPKFRLLEQKKERG